jgi:hypothetical protein
MTFNPVLSRIDRVTKLLNLPAAGCAPWPLTVMTTFRIHGKEVTPADYLEFLEKMLAERKTK